MPSPCSTNPIRFAIPKGRMEAGVKTLLRDAGVKISATARSYRPSISLDDFTVKVLKPRAIVEMLFAQTRDLGFAGADWVDEHREFVSPSSNSTKTNGEIIELLDTGLDTVRLVAAGPAGLLNEGSIPDRPLTVASEYTALAQRWAATRDLKAEVVRSYGATEVLPPDDADLIVDNTATGATLAANDLEIFDELCTSSTRLYASTSAMADATRRERIETFVMLLQSVLEARSRVMVEVNVEASQLDAVMNAMPCMKEPTVASLRSTDGYAVKAAVPRSDLPVVIPRIKAAGGTDILVVQPEQIVP